HFPVIQDVPQDALAIACVTVDVPTPQNPGGLIRESDETDNHLCTGWNTSPAMLKEIPSPPGHSLNNIPPKNGTAGAVAARGSEGAGAIDIARERLIEEASTETDSP